MKNIEYFFILICIFAFLFLIFNLLLRAAQSFYKRVKIRNNGFTLLELIIVLFLISLILGLSTVFFANMLPSSRFDAAVREISATIKYARVIAMVSGERKTVTIDLDSRKYMIEGHGERGIPSDIGIRVKDPLSGEINRGRYQLFFNATGNIKGGTIVLQDKKRTVDIEIDPIVGTVVIK